MTRRGKFRSLTLINWNGFFARTFDLDTSVTTLSGGNGAGKSTTMAAFITALIPDLTLLHFRNTTEAGSTTGSRDKGLYGKLRPGLCYAILDAQNSREDRIVIGVRLQQLTGRDKKVDIRPFSIQGLDKSEPLIQLLTESIGDRQARVLSLNEIKDKLSDRESTQFKQYNAITEYHSMMFDAGILARRLRSASDRSKFYRLIEASLYGGISSTITRSLRDYLLPENTGVRKAFQDMEAALRENRMTLEAIRVTQADRDLFKHLISEATNYVAADYMRHANMRLTLVEETLTKRQEISNIRLRHMAEKKAYENVMQALVELQAQEYSLEEEYQCACEDLTKVQTAARQQEKIRRNQDEIDNLAEQLELQQERVLQAQENHHTCITHAEAAEQEVDSLKDQLANYQYALDVQQTRAIKRQQAQQALERAKDVCQLSELTPENAENWKEEYEAREQEIIEKRLILEHKIRSAEADKTVFEETYQILRQIFSDVSRQNAWHKARDLLLHRVSQKHRAEQLPLLRAQLTEAKQRVAEQSEAQQLFDEFCRKQSDHAQSIALDITSLDALRQEFEAQIGLLSEEKERAAEERMTLRQEAEQLQEQINALKKRAPEWLKARDTLLQLHEQSTVLVRDQKLENHQQLNAFMQKLLELEREATLARDEVSTRNKALEQQIAKLIQPGGSEDPRLNALAERFGGILLSEIYDDIQIEDAAYFSALHGEFRHAIVLPNLSQIKEELNSLEDCPDDLYLIEGDPQFFDDRVFDVHELNGAVLVKITEQQWRYSRFPAVPLFGQAARERQLDRLREESENLKGLYAEHAFTVQKIQRIHEAFSQFIGQYLTVVFEKNPETEIQRLTARRSEIERTLRTYDTEKSLEQKLGNIKNNLTLLNRLLPKASLLLDAHLLERYKELQELVTEAQDAAQFLEQHDKNLAYLEKSVDVLQNLPEEQKQVEQDYQQLVHLEHKVHQQVFLLTEVTQRRAHFSYSEELEENTDTDALRNKLNELLEQAERKRNTARKKMYEQQSQLATCSQTLTSLRSAHQTRLEMLKELEQEIEAIGVQINPGAEARAIIKRDEQHQALHESRTKRREHEKHRLICETKIDSLQKSLNSSREEFQQARQHLISMKVNWQTMLRIVKESGLERRLHKRELAYISGDELRSISDRSLGALRLALADNEFLRHSLRASEDSKHPEKKIRFFEAMYQHLRERIRHDIIHTEDPIEAIEQMEIELRRLTEELTTRGQTLAISSRTVANIIRKTIHREQSRIRQLNQGLQQVRFGQVYGVRLNVKVPDGHAIFLDLLAGQEEHHDLFNNDQLTFSEAIAKLYQRLNPQLDIGQRTAQSLGENLLDYRNYLEMEVEVNRGSEGWLRAESGALSTGEAIGTGMSILIMVVQSWEEESRHLRGKDISPCRLLFLDEAARLDGRSIATLFELCERLNMQLVIAAPENISPEKGTTYKLVRKLFNNTEHVQVVGLSGFSNA